MKEKAISVIFCGGWKFSTREKELEVIKGSLNYHGVNLEDKYDFSQAIFEFVHDDDNNRVVAELSRNDWKSQNYQQRSFLQQKGGIIVRLQSGKTFGFANGEVLHF